MISLYLPRRLKPPPSTTDYLGAEPETHEKLPPFSSGYNSSGSAHFFISYFEVRKMEMTERSTDKTKCKNVRSTVARPTPKNFLRSRGRSERRRSKNVR